MNTDDDLKHLIILLARRLNGEYREYKKLCDKRSEVPSIKTLIDYVKSMTPCLSEAVLQKINEYANHDEALIVYEKPFIVKVNGVDHYNCIKCDGYSTNFWDSSVRDRKRTCKSHMNPEQDGVHPTRKRRKMN